MRGVVLLGLDGLDRRHLVQDPGEAGGEEGGGCICIPTLQYGLQFRHLRNNLSKLVWLEAFEAPFLDVRHPAPDCLCKSVELDQGMVGHAHPGDGDRGELLGPLV